MLNFAFQSLLVDQIAGLSSIAMLEPQFILLIVLFLTFGLIFLYKISKTFRFYVKYGVYNCCFLFSAVYAFFIGVCHPFDVENFHRAKDFVYWILVKVFSIRVDIEGTEIFNALEGKNFIIVANHQSSLDMFLLLKATPPTTTFLAKRELLLAPLFGVAAWLFGVVFINRGNTKRARDVMTWIAKEVIDKKVRTVVV